MKRTLTMVACFLLVVPVLFSPFAEAQGKRLRLGFSTIDAGQSVVWVTKEAGLFQKNGLEVELLFVGSSTVMSSAMLAGDVPLAVMSGIGAITTNLAGSDMIILGSLKKDPAQAFLVTSKAIEGPAQLKGKRLGVSRLGASSDFFLRLALQKLGLDPDRDVQILQVGSAPLRRAAMEAGSLDGTALTYTEKVAAEKIGFRTILDLSKMGLEGLNSDLVTTKRYIRQAEDVVKRFVRGMVEGIHFYKSRRSESLDIMARYMRTGDRDYLETAYGYEAEVFLKKPYPTMKGVQLALEQLQIRDPRARGVSPERFVESRFVKELDESGFIDSLYR